MNSDELQDFERAKSVLTPFMGEKVSEHRDEEGQTAEDSLRLGGLCFEDEDFRGALAHYRKAEEQGATGPDFYFSLGAALDGVDAQDEALDAFAKSFDFVATAETALAAAAAAKSMGMRKEAEEWLNRAIAVGPRNPFPWFKLSQLQRDGGLRKAAAKSAAKAAEFAETDSFYFMHLGDMAMDAEDFETAATSLRKALELNPTDHEAMTLLGIALWRGKKPEEAVRALRLAMELEPEPRLVPGLLSVMFRTLGYDDDAEVEESKVDKLGRYDKEQLARLRLRMIDTPKDQF